MDEFYNAIIIGFIAQLIDGALGMAYGISASSLLLYSGVTPAVASATVHTAEVFSTGASALSHHHFKNIDKDLFKKLAVSGVCGAILGAATISFLNADWMKSWISIYLLCMGAFVFKKAFKDPAPANEVKHVARLGFVGAFLDSLGGGGWGPIVTSTLLAKGNCVRKTVGSVNSSEFLVSLASSLTFILTIGLSHAELIAGLAVGGLFAAPLGAYLCKCIPRKALMLTIGSLICLISIFNLVRAL
jgi:uncharacterized membrane protein YfcA